MKIGYKLVTADLESIMAHKLGIYTIQYKIGDWVQSWPGTPLLYFDRIEEAKNFYYRDSSVPVDARLFEIQTRYPFKHEYTWNLFNIPAIIKCAKQHKKFKHFGGAFPYGTQMCKQIKLVKEIPIQVKLRG